MNLLKSIKCLWWYITTGNKCDKDTPPGMFLDPMDPNNWEIGPIMGRENMSVGMPLHLSKHPEGMCLDFPGGIGSHAHYITMKVGSMSGLSRVVMDYRVEMSDGTKFVPVKFPDAPSIITLYFQRRDDHWTSEYEAYRWYAAFCNHSPITAGSHTLSASFDGNWTSVLSSSREKNPDKFEEALSNPRRIGFVLGGGDGLGHGVYSTAPARIVITSFRVE